MGVDGVFPHHRLQQFTLPCLCSYHTFVEFPKLRGLEWAMYFVDHRGKSSAQNVTGTRMTIIDPTVTSSTFCCSRAGRTPSLNLSRDTVPTRSTRLLVHCHLNLSPVAVCLRIWVKYGDTDVRRTPPVVAKALLKRCGQLSQQQNLVQRPTSSGMNSGQIRRKLQTIDVLVEQKKN